MGRKAKEEMEQTYDVEVITAARVVAPDDEAQSPKKKKKKSKKVVGLWEYYVKWYGYSEIHDSWQPAANLDCEALIERFWEAVGIDDEDYPIGVELHAPDEWIDREAARFRREHEKEEKRKAREDKERRKRERQAAKKMEKERKAQETRESSQLTASTSSKTKNNNKVSTTLRMNDLPLYSLNIQRQRIESSDSEEDDDSDVPLAKRPRRKQEDPLKIPSAAAFRESRDEVKQTKRKRDEGSEAALPPAKQVYPDEGRHSPGSLFSEDEIDPQRSSPVLVPPSPPAPMHMSLPFRDPPSAPTILAKPPPLPNRKTSNLGSVRVGSAPNPLAKLPSQVQQEAGPSGSGISTKARLGLGALVPLQPRKMSSAVSHKPEPVKTGSSTIMATNFRKSGGIPAAQHHPEPTLASLNATPASPLMEPTLASFADGTVVDSPIAFDPPADPFMDAPSSTMRNQVDEFLSSFMPAEMAGPLEPAAEPVVEPLPPPPLPSRVAPPPPLPTRKIFKWEGSLTVCAGTSTTDELEQSFPVVMEDQMDSKLQGLRFPFFFKSTGLDQLNATHIYHAQELASILPTHSTPTHFAKVSLQPSAAEKKHWTSFLRFLGKSQQVVLLPLSLDNDIPAHLLLAPPEVYLGIRLKIPSHIAPHVEAADNLVACILPRTLTLKQRSEGWKPELESLRELRVQIAERSDSRFHCSLKLRPLLQEATRVLDFPTKTYDYLKSTSRSWAIFPPMDSSSKSTYEVELLRSILAELKENATRKQKSVNPQKSKIHMMREAAKLDSAGVLFIHVGALRHLRRLTFMRERLLSSDYVRFYTFGSHPSVSQKFWGVREVFPCGGIVTFLPSAFLNYPLEIMENIRKISEHPFWSAYILPSVLGMVARMSGADGNDLTKWAYSYLLKAIEGGQLALIEAPPENKFCFGEPSNDHRTRWFNDYLTALPPSQEEALSFAMGAFSSVTANTPQSNWPMLIEKEVAQDLARMQTQPSILTGVPAVRRLNRCSNRQTGFARVALPG
ncbi:hypothetical protein FA13DRAFT_1818467 [Coprinellus micaceus]|uniref:Chromo domain-containing protein n=1 Tax=Coprinellus micaceus TaxID=71717 RepID=A0A4Y7SNT6_COPMI|nr:hypothetical protein FA13DRAFT_1818467 [Coprinellus micaceus]